MKKAIYGVFLVLLFSTFLMPTWQKTEELEQQLETTLPVFIGESQQTVHEKVGAPQEPKSSTNIPGLEIFLNPYMWIYYDDNKNVREIRVGTLKNGNHFKGKIFGISLEDPVEKCISLWGEPAKIEKTRYTGLSRVYWTINGFILVVEIFDVDLYRVYERSTEITGIGYRTLIGKKGEIREIRIKKDTAQIFSSDLGFSN
jgi:hypothetical protein